MKSESATLSPFDLSADIASVSAKLAALDRVQAIIEFDQSGRVLTANENFLQLMGYTLPEIVGQHHRIFCTPTHAHSVEYQDFWRSLAGGQPRIGEFKRLSKDGREVWIQASYNPILDEHGKTVRVVKFACDVTRIKQHGAEFGAMAAAIDRVQAVIEFDLTGRILRANRNFVEASGYDEAELRGQHHRIFCDPDYAASDKYREFWQKLGRGDPDAGVYRRRAKGGREFWIQASYNPIFDADGKVTRIVKFATDITASKLRDIDSSGKIAAIERAQAVIEFTLEGTVLEANQNFLGLMGYTLREVEGKHHRIFCDPEFVKTGEYAEFWAKLSRGEFHSGRFLRFGKFGQRIWIQATYNPIFDDEGKVRAIVKFATDVTREVEREGEILTKAKAMDERVQELLSAIEAISESTRQSQSMASQAHQQAERGNVSIGQVIDSISDIQKSSQEICAIVKVIGEIAAQTNLLAFNAAIEAARAGAHGAGFAVVAEEVRRLAEKCSTATREIDRLIATSVTRVQVGNDISQAAAAAFKEIATSVQTTSQSIEEIDGATEEQTRAARNVAQLISELAGRSSAATAPSS